MVLKNCLKAGTRIAAATLVAATLLPVVVNAQDEQVSEAQLEAARNVVVANKALSAFDEILPLMAEQTRTIFIQADPFKSDEVSEVTNDVALELASKRKDLNEMIYRIWANRFTVEELQQLADFYNSPLGQKLATETPSITALINRCGPPVAGPDLHGNGQPRARGNAETGRGKGQRAGGSGRKARPVGGKPTQL